MELQIHLRNYLLSISKELWDAEIERPIWHQRAPRVTTSQVFKLAYPRCNGGDFEFNVCPKNDYILNVLICTIISFLIYGSLSTS